MEGSREFVEIEVKSVLNRVSGMPFQWSINPYRGCSHGCPFCLSGDTPILMADGTTRPLEEIRVGDQVYGTERRGPYRRYVRTFVLAHQSVEKPAYRITLEDGTRLVASGDHRFLSDRGWKFVTGAEQGPMRRPHLTKNNKLMGTGAFAPPPLKTVEYKQGYLCGLIRGDGFVFQEASGGVRRVHAIRNYARRSVDDVKRVVGWPHEPSMEWCEGFLAGIFDAEGGYRRGILRISNTNPVIISFVRRCLKRLGFSFVVEFAASGRSKPVAVVRLRGGLREHLRFFHSVDPAISRKRDVEGYAVKNNARLRIAAVEPLGVRRLFDITTGTGDFIANGVISHNCYARRTHWFLDEDGVDRWSSKIFVKVNAPEVLRRELSRPSWKREEVALGTATDPYQAIEGRYKLTRRILETLAEFRTPVSIVTRSPMIQRDIEVLTALARRAGVTVCVSIATTDPGLAREIEPTVAPPEQRLRTVEALSSCGIRTGVLLAPILPGLTDQPASLEAVVQAARAYRAHFVGHNVLHLGDVTRDAFFKYLVQYHPALVPRYERLYTRKFAPAAYRTSVSRTVEELKARIHISESRYLNPPQDPEQLFLLSL